jgi:hypothetical protein
MERVVERSALNAVAGWRTTVSARLERDNQPYVQLMLWCWQQSPKDRPSMSQEQSELTDCSDRTADGGALEAE